jgi:hypothetical protein
MLNIYMLTFRYKGHYKGDTSFVAIFGELCDEPKLIFQGIDLFLDRKEDLLFSLLYFKQSLNKSYYIMSCKVTVVFLKLRKSFLSVGQSEVWQRFCSSPAIGLQLYIEECGMRRLVFHDNFHQIWAAVQ